MYDRNFHENPTLRACSKVLGTKFINTDASGNSKLSTQKSQLMFHNAEITGETVDFALQLQNC